MILDGMLVFYQTDAFAPTKTVVVTKSVLDPGGIGHFYHVRLVNGTVLAVPAFMVSVVNVNSKRDKAEYEELLKQELDKLGSEAPTACPGCGRPELHKMCPAWGTPFYMSGRLFTKEDEERIKSIGEVTQPDSPLP